MSYKRSLIMWHIYKTDGTQLTEVKEPPEKGAWFYLVNPSPAELRTVSEMTRVPLDFLGAALDEEERSRIEIEDNCLLVIINTPLLIDENNFDTIPLGVVITENHMITISVRHSEVLTHFNPDKAATFDTTKRTRFLFQILYKAAELYLKHLQFITRHTDKIELQLRKSMQNKSLFQLFELERSLVYFTGALKDNGVVMNKLMRLRKSSQFQHILQMFEEDEDLLEDVIIENEQAIEMVEMHSNILSGMMDAFASIISNNLNIVMKFLTTITILISVPTMISSFWGMNVNVPWSVNTGNPNPLGFLYVVIIAVIVTTLIAFKLFRSEKI